jgi:hypothetical protein
VPVAINAHPGDGVAFLVSAYGVYEVIAANCSSPQTTELNADKRAPTLMKWVHLGLAQSVVLVAVAVVAFPNQRVPIISGAALAAVFMEASYLYAKKAGLESNGPPTESW